MGLKKTHEALPPRRVVDRSYGRDRDGLLVQLEAPEASARRWAARDLAGDASALAALGQRLLVERDSTVREALFTAMAATPGPATVAALMPLLRSEDAQMRNGAIETMAAMPEAVAPQVQALLRDPDSDVRIFTVNLLGELRHPQVVSWLTGVLQQDLQVNVVAAAIEVLAEAGGPDQLPALHAARQRFADDPFIGFAAELASKRMVSA